MKALPPLSVGLLAILTLSACKGGGDPVEQALREEAAEHHAQAAQATAEVEPAAPTTTSDSYRVELIAEHRRTIARAERVLAANPDAETRRLAQAELDRSRAELASLEAASAR